MQRGPFGPRQGRNGQVAAFVGDTDNLCHSIPARMQTTAAAASSMVSAILRTGRKALYALIYETRLTPTAAAAEDRVRGLFEEISYRSGTLTVSGWMLLPREPLESISVFIAGRHVGEAAVRDRQDLVDAFPFIPHAGRAGFAVSLPMDLAPIDGSVDLSLVAMINGKPVDSMDAWFLPALPFRVPPAHLLQRVTGTDNETFFRATSFQSFRDLWSVACKWREPGTLRSMLDWGCGCGRLINTFGHLSTIGDINGCDIDAEAIAWCRANFSGVRFSVNPPVPPTEYADNTFDLVIGNSVLTHLTMDLQLAWLDEMRRITAPGGLCLASVLGESATYYSHPDPRVRFILSKAGLFDEWKDISLDGVAPPGYYRDTLQTRAYTVATYGKYFEILDYLEGGWLKFQDLVVMQKR